MPDVGAMMIEAEDIAYKLDQSLKSLQADRKAVVAAEGTEQEIASVDALIKDTTEARDLIVLRAFERRQQRERYAQWQALLPKCAVAREEYQAAAAEVREHTREGEVCRDALRRASDRLNDHLANPPRPESYPSSKEKRAWELRRAALERDVTARKEELKENKEGEVAVASRYQRAQSDFESLSRQELRLRPLEKYPKIVSVGERVIYGPELTPAR
jgi:hypothetical protein